MPKDTKKTTTEAQRRAIKKYQTETVEEIKIRVPKGEKDYYKAAAEMAGLSLNMLFITAADEKISRDGLDPRGDVMPFE